MQPSRLMRSTAAPGCGLHNPGFGLARHSRRPLRHAGYWLCLLAALDAGLQSALAADPKKVVVPFDFQSKFDQGRYGEIVGDLFWKMLDREKSLLIPDSMHDVRDLCQANNIHLGPDTPFEQVRQAVRRDFDADIGIWGGVERVEGTTGDVYDLSIRCVDFSAQPEPKVIYEKDVRTRTVSEIPHLYGKQMLDELCGRTPGQPRPPDATAEENWKNNPNLLAGGDFETATGGVPKGWEARAGQQREPLGSLVRWLPEPGKPQNHVIRFTFPKIVGDNEGVMYYSQPFPVEEGATYRFQCRWRTNGPAVKVFIKCYDEAATPYSQEDGQASGGRSYQRREVYRSQQNLKGPPKTWNTHTEDFTPKHTRYTPRWGRVMLYAYLGEGDVEFDDVVVRQIATASASQQVEPPRHSLESNVTIEEMNENQRRSKTPGSKVQTPKP